MILAVAFWTHVLFDDLIALYAASFGCIGKRTCRRPPTRGDDTELMNEPLRADKVTGQVPKITQYTLGRPFQHSLDIPELVYIVGCLENFDDDQIAAFIVAEHGTCGIFSDVDDWRILPQGER